MKKILQSLVLFGVLALVAPAFAANLGAFNASCGGAGANAALAITGNIGDTFTVTASLGGNGGCFIANTTAGIVNPNAGFFGLTATQIFTLTAAGTTTLTTTQGFGITFTVTVNAPVATPVPTLSQWGLVLLASLMAMVGIAATRRRQD